MPGPSYEAIYRAGEQFGIRKLGIHAYMMNHTENGFPQAYYHFPYPWGEDKGFLEFLSSMGGAIGATTCCGAAWVPIFLCATGIPSSSVGQP